MCRSRGKIMPIDQIVIIRFGTWDDPYHTDERRLQTQRNELYFQGIMLGLCVGFYWLRIPLCIVFILFATFEIKWHARHLAISTFKAVPACLLKKENDKWTEKSSFYALFVLQSNVELSSKCLNDNKGRTKNKGFKCLSLLQHAKLQRTVVECGLRPPFFFITSLIFMH